jgi:hypothetical protein
MRICEYGWKLNRTCRVAPEKNQENIERKMMKVKIRTEKSKTLKYLRDSLEQKIESQ